ncbi:MAG: acetaldehyde dehydrogenase (acetylating) [Oscillospiraceae bacterium]|nr:acetaldehyde dehydrogenase (acetylating) [Oscillospiraceae bacterium]
MRLDKDLQSVQEVRLLVEKAANAQQILASYNQERLDEICAEMARIAENNAEKLAKMAHEETGYGVWQDKVRKNLLASRDTWAHAKLQKVVGVLRSDKERGLIEIGVPVGVIAAIIPSTNPTSTTIYKAILSIKSGNAAVFSPHPAAQKSIAETVNLLRYALIKTGTTEDALQCIKTITPQATDALMKYPKTALILATGGEAMVKAAYSSGTPAIGVGPGNGPAFIERSADVPQAVGDIIQSKTFDNGVICASEQSIVVESVIALKVEQELKKRGGVFLNKEDSGKLAEILLRANGSMNPAIVGKSAVYIAQMAGINVPQDTKLLISKQIEVSAANPYSREKLCPVLGYYEEPDWRSACERCMALLYNEGVGHTMSIHSADQEVIREFSMKKPVSRLLVNTPAALGGVGATTALPPAFTLGCGAIGGSATGDNIEARHLTNIRRVAWGQLRGQDSGYRSEELEYRGQDTRYRVQDSGFSNEAENRNPQPEPANNPNEFNVTQQQVAQITREVYRRLSQL